MLLVHDERLRGLVDAWLTGVPAQAFDDVLPLLRRTFAAYEAGVRRTLGELVRRGPGERGSAGHGGAGVPGFGDGLDAGRADAVLPVLGLLLGLPGTEEKEEPPHTGLPHTGLPHAGLPHAGLPHAGLPGDGFPPAGLPRDGGRDVCNGCGEAAV
jgi:hypothetical protein